MAEKNTGMVASAMNYAIPLGLFWVFKYIFVILGDNYDRSLYIESLLSIFTPVIYYILLCRYRDVNKEGKLDYGDAILFSLLLFLFASLFEVVMVCLHIYIINPATLSIYAQQIRESGSLEQTQKLLSTFGMNGEVDKDMFENYMDFYASHIGVIFIFSRIFVNFLLGLFLSLVLGYFVSRQRPNQSQKL